MSSHSQYSSFTDLFLTIFGGVIAFLDLLIFVPLFILLVVFFFFYFWEYYRAAIYNWLKAHESEAWLSSLPEDDQDLEDQESSVGVEEGEREKTTLLEAGNTPVKCYSTLA